VQTCKAHKIDLTQEYPCPCRCRGKLSPIALTEAFGCLRCQQIFVLSEDAQVLEKLVTHYPYKQAWCWRGDQWQRANNGWQESFLPLAFGIIGFLLFVWLPLAQSPLGNHMFFFVSVALLLIIVPALMVWLAYRR
jgi:hypothetical protein